MATKEVELYIESDITKVASLYSFACKLLNNMTNSTVNVNHNIDSFFTNNTKMSLIYSFPWTS